MPEAAGAELFFQLVVVGPGGGRDDTVDVIGGSDSQCRLAGKVKLDGGAADEDDVVLERTKAARRQGQHIQVLHPFLGQSLFSSS